MSIQKGSSGKTQDPSTVLASWPISHVRVSEGSEEQEDAIYEGSVQDLLSGDYGLGEVSEEQVSYDHGGEKGSDRIHMYGVPLDGSEDYDTADVEMILGERVKGPRFEDKRFRD